jgi:alpha-tubulin suppressor-like RCC1 family protein
LGHGDETGENIPKEIVALRDHKIISIESGDAHSACINSKNELFTWGVGSYGRLGNGKTANILVP